MAINIKITSAAASPQTSQKSAPKGALLRIREKFRLIWNYFLVEDGRQIFVDSEDEAHSLVRVVRLRVYRQR